MAHRNGLQKNQGDIFDQRHRLYPTPYISLKYEKNYFFQKPEGGRYRSQKGRCQTKVNDRVQVVAHNRLVIPMWFIFKKNVGRKVRLSSLILWLRVDQSGSEWDPLDAEFQALSIDNNCEKNGAQSG